jgi:dihydroorotate dehydrogenase (NAD+) catalytic subunit
VYDVHRSLPDLAIVGVGGIVSGWDAVELMLAGASAVQVGTATFADPRAPWHVLDMIIAWAEGEGISSLADLTGALG